MAERGSTAEGKPPGGPATTAAIPLAVMLDQSMCLVAFTRITNSIGPATQRDTEAVELSPVVVHTYPAFRITDHNNIFQLLCPSQSPDKAYVQVYDPRKN